MGAARPLTMGAAACKLAGMEIDGAAPRAMPAADADARRPDVLAVLVPSLASDRWLGWFAAGPEAPSARRDGPSSTTPSPRSERPLRREDPRRAFVLTKDTRDVLQMAGFGRSTAALGRREE